MDKNEGPRVERGPEKALLLECRVFGWFGDVLDLVGLSALWWFGPRIARWGHVLTSLPNSIIFIDNARASPTIKAPIVRRGPSFSSELHHHPGRDRPWFRASAPASGEPADSHIPMERFGDF